MKTEEIILNNLKVLSKYRTAKKIKNSYLEGSSFRSNLSRKNLPTVTTIIKLCEEFKISTNDFFTKELEIKLIFKDSLESKGE